MSIGDELMRLYDEYGELTPKIVVEAARDESSPLHEHFEWDPEVAHYEYLISRARQIIRKVKIRVEDPGDLSSTVVTRAFVSLVDDDDMDARHYVPSVVVAEHDTLREQALEQMERDFLALRRKWATFSKAFDMMVSRHIDITIIDEEDEDDGAA